MEIRAILKMTNYELTTQKPMHGISLLCGPKQPVQESLYTCLRTIKRAGYLICILTCMGKPLMTMKLDLSDACRCVDVEKRSINLPAYSGDIILGTHASSAA